MVNKRKASEKRKEGRIYCSGDVLINGELCKTIDLSVGGVYVHTSTSIKEKSIIDVTFPLKNKGALTIEAKVRHSQPGVGIGLQFIGLDSGQKKMLQQIVVEVTKKFASPVCSPDTRKVILMVEDNRMAREMYKNGLYMEGFSVIEATDGGAALELLKTTTPDLIVLDLNMGKMDGVKVLMILKASPKWKSIPVIVLSSHGTKDVIDKVMVAGATEFLSKMITSPLKLSETIKNILRLR
jgi:CheY-like chemotaxis protein